MSYAMALAAGASEFHPTPLQRDFERLKAIPNAIPRPVAAKACGLRRADWMENPVPLEEVATHIDALVARDAAKRLEQFIAGQLLRRDRGGNA